MSSTTAGVVDWDGSSMFWTLLQDPLSLSGLDIEKFAGWRGVEGEGEGQGRGGGKLRRPHMDTNMAKSQCRAEQGLAGHRRFLSAGTVPITHAPANKTAMSPVDGGLRIDPTSMLACTWQACKTQSTPTPGPLPLDERAFAHAVEPDVALCESPREVAVMAS